MLTARFNPIHSEPQIQDRVLRLAQVLSHHARSANTGIYNRSTQLCQLSFENQPRCTSQSITMSFAATIQGIPLARAFTTSSLSKPRSAQSARRAPLIVRAKDPAAPDKAEVKGEVVDCKLLCVLIVLVLIPDCMHALERKFSGPLFRSRMRRWRLLLVQSSCSAADCEPRNLVCSKAYKLTLACVLQSPMSFQEFRSRFPTSSTPLTSWAARDPATTQSEM